MTTHLKGFGLENFRVFKDYTWFDFAPITILTGPNSSGKSSLIKALLLLENSISKSTQFKLDFSNDNVYQLGNFERIINNKSSRNIVSFHFPYQLQHFPTLGEYCQCQASVIFKKEKDSILATATEFSIKIYNKPILVYGNNNLFFDLDFFVEKISLSKKYEVKINERTKIRRISADNPDILSFSEFVTFVLVKKMDAFEIKQREQLFEDGRIRYRRGDEKGYSVMIEKNIKTELEEILNLYKKEIQLKNGSPNAELTTEISSTTYDSELEEEVNEFMDTYIDKYPLRTILGTYGLSENLIEFIDSEVLGFNNRLLKGEWLNNLQQIQYQPAVRGKVNRIYRKEEKDVLNELITAFFEKKLPRKNIDFVQKWSSNFNLLGEIKPFLDSKYNVQSIEIGSLPLIEQGLGISQLVAILLTIVTKEDNKKIFIFEEPEANLHPKFQSLLADMFIDAAKTFNIQFIIETHSEYFIRKMQYLTAKKEVSPTDTNIYYFHDPENIPAGEPQVKKIEILEDGSLSSDFGPGFFDEATNWKFELMRLKNAQKN